MLKPVSEVHGVATRAAGTPMLSILTMRLKLTDDFSVVGPTIWNQIPLSMQKDKTVTFHG